MDEVPAIEIVNINPETELSPWGFRTRKYGNRNISKQFSFTLPSLRDLHQLVKTFKVVKLKLQDFLHIIVTIFLVCHEIDKFSLSLP